MLVSMGHGKCDGPFKTWIMTVREDLLDFEITNGLKDDPNARRENPCSRSQPILTMSGMSFDDNF